MKIPIIRGVIERRILVNYQVDPGAIRRMLPGGLEPKIIKDVCIGGICLIRLREIRPRLIPKVFGARSENAAHRIAVVLPDGSEGVYIPRRDTSSRLNALTGGRLFPGRHDLSHFAVREDDERFEVSLEDRHGTALLRVTASLADRLPEGSVFSSIKEASAFFEVGSLGYSPSNETGRLDGLELRTKSWRMVPLDVEHVRSAFFENSRRFPPGSIQFDSALLMRDIQHEWHTSKPLYCGELQHAV